MGRVLNFLVRNIADVFDEDSKKGPGMSYKPICITHRVELKTELNGATVHYPIAQYIYAGDLWSCPVRDCPVHIMLRAMEPVVQGYDENYYRAREDATVKMWNL